MVGSFQPSNLILNIDDECPKDEKTTPENKKDIKKFAKEHPAVSLDNSEFVKNWSTDRNLLETFTDSNDNNLVRVIEDCENRLVLEINLEDAGVKSSVIDRLRPRIIVRQQCRCSQESQATYAITVRLLKEPESVDLCRYPVKRVGMSTLYWHKGEGKSDWQSCEVILDRYPTGIRGIVIESESRLWNKSDANVVFGKTEVFLDFEKKEIKPAPLAESSEKPMIFFV